MAIEDKNKNHIFWIMGPSASGKTTLANHFLSRIKKNGKLALHYDGDEVRDFFGAGLGFKKEDRLKVVKTLTHLSNKALDAGLNVIVSALTANQDAREYVFQNVKNMVLVYLECSIEKCMQRDPKGLYKKAVNREIDTVIGYNNEYLAPENPDIIVNTDEKSVESSALELMGGLHELGLVF